MTYEISYNPQYNSHEVRFDGKPSEEVRTALKAMRFRWHSVNKCWYGYNQSEESIAAAITGASTEEEPNTVYGDGYLGGGSVYGSKSNNHLYGSDLSAAIRADIKKAGIKGVTVKCHSYSGGQNITATIKCSPADYIPWDDFLTDYQISPSTSWIYLPGGECIFHEKYWGADADERERIRRGAAAHDYERYTKHENTPRVSWINWLTDEALKKVERIDSIISAYRYDNSNGMVDYFDTNFYYDLCLKPVTA